MRTTSRKIVVGYDGSDLADLALRWAVDTAALRHDPVEVLVASALSTTMGAWAPTDHAYVDAMREVADQAEKRVLDLGHPEFRVRFVHGDAVQELVAAGEHASMLVVGATGHSRLAAGVLGSVSRHLATYAPCPVVVVRPSASDNPRVVVGVEEGASSVPALKFAMERAEATGAPVTAVHAFQGLLPYAGEIALPRPAEEELYFIAQEALNNALKHAAATVVVVRISGGPGATELVIADNGRGFDVNTATGGLGLVGMRERAARIGASVEIGPRRRGGTEVVVKLASDSDERDPAALVADGAGHTLRDEPP